MNLACWLMTILGTNPVFDAVARDSVDLVEVNHFYDEQARLVFDQLVWYVWREDIHLPERGESLFGVPARAEFRGSRYQVVDWRLIKTPECLPVRDWRTGGYVSFWLDGEVLRQVRAKDFRETWLQYDPELEERAWLPKDGRPGLSRPLVKKRIPGH